MKSPAMHIRIHHPRAFKGPGRQRGMIAMIIAITVLVSTLLAVIGLMRSVDTSNLIAGALTFKQGAVQEAERAYSVAKANIPYGTAANTDSSGVGYYASVQSADTTRTDLPASMVGSSPSIGVTLPAGTTGNTVRYVIERLCRVNGAASKDSCVVPTAYIAGGTNDEAGSVITPSTAQSAYRLTVRVDGPKNAQAFVQTVLR